MKYEIGSQAAKAMAWESWGCPHCAGRGEKVDEMNHYFELCRACAHTGLIAVPPRDLING